MPSRWAEWWKASPIFSNDVLLVMSQSALIRCDSKSWTAHWFWRLVQP
jgi:hypothetical protein